MDSFTQRLLDRAEQRSKALGITSTSKFPLSDFNEEQTESKKSPTRRSPSKGESSLKKKERESPKKSITKITRQTSDRRFSRDSKENCDVAVEINITTGSDCRVQVEVEEHEIDSEGNITKLGDSKCTSVMSTPVIRDTSRNRLQRLGALYSDTENLSSPIHRTEARFNVADENNEQSASSAREKSDKMAALTNAINNWEDETIHDYKKVTKTTHKDKPSVKPQSKNDCALKSILSPKKTFDTEKNPSSRQLQWDKKIMDDLESKGFQRRESSSSKMVYDYQNKESDKKPLEIRKEPVKTNEIKIVKDKEVVPTKSVVTKTHVSQRTAMFEGAPFNKGIPGKNQKDPAEMSLKERMALFEKNKGTALIPKAAFGISASAKQIMGEQRDNVVIPIPTVVPKFIPAPSVTKPSVHVNKVTAEQQKPTETKGTGNGIRNTVAALLSGTKTISESKINDEVQKQRQQEMNLLLNRYQKEQSELLPKPSAPPMTPPKAPPMPPCILECKSKEQYINNKRRSDDTKYEDSPEVKSTIEDVKRVKVNPLKDGRVYPVLSDHESTVTDTDQDNYTTAEASASEDLDYSKNSNNGSYSYDEEDDSYMDSQDANSSADICNGSLGREIMQAVKRNDPLRNGKKVTIQQYDSSTTSEISDVLGDIDDCLDEALDEEDEMDEQQVNKVKTGTISSNSFCFKRNLTTSNNKYDTIDEEEVTEHQFRTPVSSELTVNPSKDNEMVTLVHTVSFYRRQQTNIASPARKVPRPTSENYCSSQDDELYKGNNESLLVQEKVKKLLDEVCKQQQIISQTSQALNLCASTVEFSGSTESVEGERHLLVASHRRQAALDEVQRLRIEKCLRPMGSPREKGCLCIKDITVPLKQDYIRKLAADAVPGHNLVCLLKYNENVLATKTIPTLPGLVSVRFPDVLQLNNAYADFKVTLEIYGMTAQREILPHDVKYHISNNKKNSNKLTPKGRKYGESPLSRPTVQSPAGPNAVRTPALTHYGFVIFSLREIQRNSWSLNQVSAVSPLEGTIHMKVNCELSVSIDFRGFLTMFEDVSGFGAWHRRWCRLQGHVLNYWKYPDDEKKKMPMGSLDLYACSSKKIATAPRDVCARLNTILLECKRPAQDDDVDSLVLVRQGNTTIVRHLLSADTKEERDNWCAHLNKAIVLLRAWGNSE